MKSSFPKRDKRQSKNRICNANSKFGDCIFEKNYVHTYLYINITRKDLFQSTIYKLGIGIANQFAWNGAYSVLEKSSSRVPLPFESVMLLSDYSTLNLQDRCF